MTEDLAKLGLIELLDLLEPVPDPPSVSMWPQTGGWIVVCGVLVVTGAWLVWRIVRNRRANAYRRAALREIELAGDEVAALAGILRRTALAAFPRAEVAGLYGEAWLAFLDRSYGGNAFQEGPGRAFALAPYVPSRAEEPLAPLASEWVRRHRPPTGAGA